MVVRHLCVTLLIGLALLPMGESSLEGDDRPNVVLLMVDDMGFSDLGCYGGEIHTPNIDRLANAGLRFTQFYNCAKCETTRSTLLSGRYYPEVNNRKLEHCITIAEAMQLGGYQTIMTGKWHLEENPLARGFEDFFGHLSGATNFFTGDDSFRLGNEKFDVPSSGFYTTDANVDYALKFLEKRSSVPDPFFLYIAFNAPHYPLQAPKEDVQKYLGKYSGGWDKLRQTRLKRQKAIGIVSAETNMGDRPEDVPAWNSLTAVEKNHQQLMMATYAAMIDRVDQNIGRLISHLEKNGDLENTLILFLSDNGACPFQRSQQKSIQNQLAPWNPKSYWTYDKGWAHACNTPFREYKQDQHEGGISTPLIAHWPAAMQDRVQGTITRQVGHLVDIHATCCEIAGINYPDVYQGATIGKARGVSLSPVWKGQSLQREAPLFFSFYGKNNAIRDGNWKLVNRNHGEFELYNIANDRTESQNRAADSPERYLQMKSKFQNLFTDVGQKVSKKSKQKNKRKAKSGKKPSASATKSLKQN